MSNVGWTAAFLAVRRIGSGVSIDVHLCAQEHASVLSLVKAVDASRPSTVTVGVISLLPGPNGKLLPATAYRCRVSIDRSVRFPTLGTISRKSVHLNTLERGSATTMIEL